MVCSSVRHVNSTSKMQINIRQRTVCDRGVLAWTLSDPNMFVDPAKSALNFLTDESCIRDIQGGPPALNPLRFGHLFHTSFRLFLKKNVVFLKNRSVEKGAQNHVCFWALSMKNTSLSLLRHKCVMKHQIFCSFHVDTPTHDTNRCAKTRFAPKHKCL